MPSRNLMFQCRANHQHVQQPESEEANPHAGRKGADAGERNLQHGIDRLTADPGLNAEPTASHQRAQNRRHIRAAHAERRAHKNRKRNAVLRARVRVQQHRNEHDQVAQQNRADRLPPTHAAGDQTRRQHVSRNADAHATHSEA